MKRNIAIVLATVFASFAFGSSVAEAQIRSPRYGIPSPRVNFSSPRGRNSSRPSFNLRSVRSSTSVARSLTVVPGLSGGNRSFSSGLGRRGRSIGGGARNTRRSTAAARAFSPVSGGVSVYGNPSNDRAAKIQRNVKEDYEQALYEYRLQVAKAEYQATQARKARLSKPARRPQRRVQQRQARPAAQRPTNRRPATQQRRSFGTVLQRALFHW